ncbi:MAG: heme ABC exporter ATP-binding protein CcmA [Magnetococcus sp. WYHC-3]
MAALSAAGISHRFGRHRVLDDVALELGPGECITLFGPNGAGKSTLLNILANRLRPRSGTLMLDGQDARLEPEAYRARLYYLSHHSHLYGHLTPVENLRFFADLHALTGLDDARFLDALERVGLKRFARRTVAGFSAGMRKRVALARVLLASPSLLLLDEPYSALDAQGVHWLNTFLQGYQAQGGSILMVTHDPERVAALDRHAWELRDGRLVPQGRVTPC